MSPCRWASLRGPIRTVPPWKRPSSNPRPRLKLRSKEGASLLNTTGTTVTFLKQTGKHAGDEQENPFKKGQLWVTGHALKIHSRKDYKGHEVETHCCLGRVESEHGLSSLCSNKDRNVSLWKNDLNGKYSACVPGNDYQYRKKRSSNKKH